MTVLNKNTECKHTVERPTIFLSTIVLVTG